jgi:hypothetical protein
MPDGSVIVADADIDKLTRLGRAFKHSLFRDQQQLDLLDQTLAAAEVRPSARVPRDVVRDELPRPRLQFRYKTEGALHVDISRGGQHFERHDLSSCPAGDRTAWSKKGRRHRGASAGRDQNTESRKRSAATCCEQNEALRG